MIRLDADWITAPACAAVMAALDRQGYFVGGCVRNALMGEPVADIDIATPIMPDDVVRRLEASGLKAVPTGLKHGTVTAVLNGEPVEITTFRTDIETDGRHAVVQFTDDIARDAARRDFTMNALYAAADGEVIDPLGGLPDLRARRVRFINDPRERIREDYLRILRFFRFHAWYGSDGIDQEGLAACADLADGLDGLARERIGWEIRKLLSAPEPCPAVASMAAAGILQRILPGASADGLFVVVDLEERFDQSPDWLLRLAALGVGDSAAGALRLSKAEQRAIAALAAAMEEPTAEVAAYRHGREAAWRASLLRAAALGADPGADRPKIEQGASARFPISAGDLIARGVRPGPQLGAELARLEAVWIAGGFTLTKSALLAQTDGDDRGN